MSRLMNSRPAHPVLKPKDMAELSRGLYLAVFRGFSTRAGAVRRFNEGRRRLKITLADLERMEREGLVKPVP